MDTTRADRLGAYGHTAAGTPTIDGLAAEGTRFDRAYATVPLTTPSHASMLSGLYPTRHGIHTNGDAILSDEVTTLAEHLKGAGYRTAASVSAFVTTRVWNLDQGFDTYADELPRAGGNRWGRERPAEEVVDDLVTFLEGEADTEDPLFLWAHFYDPHHPHEAPPEFTDAFPDIYDAEIASMDAQIGRLKAALARVRPEDNTAWILVADHGEAFNNEHGELSHGLFLYDEVMRIPFILRPPAGLAAAVQVSDRAVSNVDVMPSALGMLGLAVPPGLDGHDLSPFTRGGQTDRDGAYMEARTVSERFGYHPEIAYAMGHHKLMDTPNPHLYDLRADPAEATNLIATDPARAEELRRALSAVLAEAVEVEGSAPAPEVFEQLAALGYIGGDLDEDAESSTIDAKDRLKTIYALEATRSSMKQGDTAAVEAAVRTYREIIEREPQISEAAVGLANALTRLDRDAEALQVYEEALERNPDSTVIASNYANALASAGRHDDGLAQMERVLAQVPGDEQARVGTLKMLADLRREPEAVARGKVWLGTDPDNTAIQAHVGVIMVKLGQVAEAEPHLRASLTDGIPRQFVHRSLGTLAIRANQPEAAAEHFAKELNAFPKQDTTRRTLAKTLMGLERWEEAAAEYAVLLAAKPDPMARTAWAQAVFNAGDYSRAAEVLAPALKVPQVRAQSWLLQANILDKQGNREAAVATFKRATAAREAERSTP
jgi:arylsulfatase A-like enzyme/Tfp pilus assembly protein PilF